MIHECHQLHELFPQLPVPQSQGTLRVLALSRYDCETANSKEGNPAVIICPGGGYVYTSPREGDPVALPLLAAGFSCFILDYAVAPDRHPLPLLHTAAAIRWVRSNAERLNIHPDKIALMGFSAGGHAACAAALLHDDPVITATLGGQAGDYRPNAAVACYPVITAEKPFAHTGSFNALLGPGAAKSALDDVSLEKRVTAKAPPFFIWHTGEDTAVPVENALLLAGALQACRVPFELHIYPYGWHGLSTCDGRSTDRAVTEDMVHAASWMPLCIQWLRRELHVR